MKIIALVQRRSGFRAGMDKALVLLAPYLEQAGISLYFARVSAWGPFFRDLARITMSGDRRRAEWILFNSLSAVSASRSAFVRRFYWLLGRRKAVIWRESKSQWDRLKRDSQVAHLTAKSFALDASCLHLSNSAFTAQEMTGMFPQISVQSVGNCAFMKVSEVSVGAFEPPLVVTVGNVVAHKRPDLFVETAVRVCAVHPTVEFWWIGEGEMRAEMIARTEEAGFPGRVLFPGWMEAPDFLLAKARVVFVTSRTETYSQVTAEAMACGRGVVCFEGVGGPEEILEGNGTIVETDSADKAAGKILELLALPFEFRSDLKALYEAKHSPEAQAQRLVAVFRGSGQEH